jgi:hypothetical protein
MPGRSDIYLPVILPEHRGRTDLRDVNGRPAISFDNVA